MKDPLLRTLYIAAAALLIGLVAWRVAERRITGGNQPISALNESPDPILSSPRATFEDNASDSADAVEDEPLAVTDSTIAALVKLRAEQKAFGLSENGERLERSINRLLERLISGAREHPSTLWVLERCQEEMESVAPIIDNDADANERYIEYFQRIIVTLGIAYGEHPTS